MKGLVLALVAVACILIGVVAVARPDQARLPVSGDKRRSGILLIVAGVIGVITQLVLVLAS